MIELLVIFATLLVLVCVLIPSMIEERHTVCLNNLRQVGLAVKTCTIGDDICNPACVSTNYGGTAELILSGQVFVHFQVLSNELGEPRRLVCPADKAKKVAKRFDVGFSDTNVSYFFGVNSRDTSPDDFLAGDRNLSSNRLALRPGLFTLSTNSPLSWTKAIHRSCGYVAFADGSVRLLNQSNLTFSVRLQSTVTNRLAIP